MEAKITTTKDEEIETITQKVVNLLKQKGFETYEERTEEKITILASNSPYYNAEHVVQITVEKNEKQITIKLELIGEKAPIRNIWLMHMIGAGAILVNQWHKKDTLTRLRKEIWENIKTITKDLNSNQN